MDQNIFNHAFSRATALMNDDRFNSWHEDYETMMYYIDNYDIIVEEQE